nr:hypothetical protein 8D4.70 [imported] - Neurospora crassa [Neurospora crassa]
MCRQPPHANTFLMASHDPIASHLNDREKSEEQPGAYCGRCPRRAGMISRHRYNSCCWAVLSTRCLSKPLPYEFSSNFTSSGNPLHRGSRQLASRLRAMPIRGIYW